MKFVGFLKAKGGNFAMSFALALPMLLGAVAFAVDMATITRAQSKLQNALDAAMLAASRINDADIDREQIFQNFFRANVGSDFGLANAVATFDVDRGLNYIASQGSANADVQLFLPMIFADYHNVSASARVFESRDSLEVVMALDNTGSMGSARMGELRKAATALVNILATVHSPDLEPKRIVKAALVPFVTAVNAKGTGFDRNWIDWNMLAPHHGVNFEPRTNHIDLFNKLGLQWKGCVEARPAPYNLSDAAPDPSRPETLFVPYFAPDEPGDRRLPRDSTSQFNNTYLDDMVEGALLDRQKSLVKYDTSPRNMIRDSHASVTSGPNYACPTPIVPLTSDFAHLKSEIGKMIHWYGSGTNVSEGLAWAKRVLSPGAPYTEGAPFRSENTSKFVVVFTDGENNVFGASGEGINKSDYGSYGFVDQGRIDSNRGRALTKVNSWTLEVCESLKSEGVEVFTVLLGADTAANRTLYSACASTPQNYYPTSDVSQLDSVFRKIASRIARLYVTG